MENFKVTISKVRAPIQQTSDSVFCQGNLSVESSVETLRFDNERGHFFLIGNILGLQQANGVVSALRKSDLPELFRVYNPEQIRDQAEGSFVVIWVGKNGHVHVSNDRFGKTDVYYSENSDSVVIASDLGVFEQKGKFDQAALVYALMIYGGRPPRNSTIYEDVKRLGVGESLECTKAGLVLKRSSFVPKESFECLPHTDAEAFYLDQYADRFLEALKLRSSSQGNIVYLSSGWDSSSILAGLVHLYGPKKVRGVIGRMQYSERAGVINPYEISRAKAIADFFGIELDIVEFDYHKNGPKYLEHTKALFQGNSFYNMTPMNWFLLSRQIKEKYGTEQSVFCGEISDGAHNLGFSQFTSIFHATSDFREYSDKMRSYLFGPTFFNLVKQNKHQNDFVYQSFANMFRESHLVPLESGDSRKVAKQMLEGFFLSTARFPGYSSNNEKMFTASGIAAMRERTLPLIDEVAPLLNEVNNYSCYLHLYNSFHWQSSTVAGLAATAKHHGFKLSLPFWDGQMFDFLSEMPESFGRGLELKETKYPLKWTMANRVKKYPFHLQVGPHSYLYDTDHSFNHANELLCHSSFTPIFKSTLSSKRYLDMLNSEYFDLNYIGSAVDKYIKDQPLSGQERDNLFSIALLQLFA